MGRGGAEQTLPALLRQIDPKKYETDLYVLLGQGELIKRVPESVHVLNKKYSRETVLSGRGRKILAGTVFLDFFRHAALARNFGYMAQNGLSMFRTHHFQADKLLWKLISDASPTPKRKYDLAVAYLEGGSTYFVADHVRAKKKTAFIHVDYRQAGYTPALDHGCYGRVDRIFCVSEDNRKSFLSAYPGYAPKTEVFHLSPDRKELERKAALPGGFTDGFGGVRVLTVARLVAQKHLDVSVRAMALYEERRRGGKSRLPEVRWYVLGDGDERRELERAIRDARLEEKFVLSGVRDNPYPYIRQADICVHCTGFEGRSIALQEEKMLGKPVIASDCSGNRELIRDGEDGILVPLEPSAIERALEKLAADPAEAARLGAAASSSTMGADGADRILNDI